MTHTITVTVTFRVEADDCSEAENAVGEALAAIPLVDGLTAVEFPLHMPCDHVYEGLKEIGPASRRWPGNL